MKKTFLLALLAALTFSAFGQMPDTAFVIMRQDTGVFERQQFFDRYDWVIGSKQPIRSLFKINMGEEGPPVSLLHLSYERKIAPAFSVQAGIGLGVQSGSDFNKVDTISIIGTDTFQVYQGYSLLSLRYSLEAKWYHNMARRIRDGRGADNMTGNYFALETAYINARNQVSGEATGFGYDQMQIALRYGLQRRLFRYGFANISYGVGARATWQGAAQQPRWDVFVNTRVGIGLALAQPNRRLPKSDRCEVLRCFREDQRMWKWDLFNLLRVSDFQNMRAGLALAREQKWGDSHWSWEVLANVKAERYKTEYRRYGTDNRSLNVGLRAHTRWYFNQKKSIAGGFSGNNLSGVYFAAGLEGRYTRGRDEFLEQRPEAGSYKIKDFSRYSVGPSGAFGFQTRIFERGFLDCQMAPTFFSTLEEGNRDGNPYRGTSFEVSSDLQFRIGLVF